MSGRELVYIVLALVGLIVPWFFNFQYAAQGGSLFNIVEFFRLGFANPVASSLTMDLTIAFVTFVLWAIPESQRIGLRAGWLYPVLGVVIAFAFAFPLFLFQRERHLRLARQTK